MTAAVKKAQELMLLVEQLFARAKEVGSKNIENEINLENARKHAVQTGIHAETASEVFIVTTSNKIVNLNTLELGPLFLKYASDTANYQTSILRFSNDEVAMCHS